MTEPVDLFAQETGTGPALLFLHGAGGEHLVWADVVQSLGGGFRAILPDLRGHGESPLPAGSTMATEEIEGDILRLLDRLEVKEAHVVAMSAGAFVALRLARDHATRVRSLVLVNGAAYCDQHSRDVLESWNEAYREGGDDALLLRLMKDLFDRDWMEAHLDFADLMRERWKETPHEAFSLWRKQVMTFDMRGRLARIKAPTLMLQGMTDVVVDPSHGRFLRQSIPGSELKIYRETGHMMPIERPKETAEAVREFVHKVESAPTAPPPG